MDWSVVLIVIMQEHKKLNWNRHPPVHIVQTSGDLKNAFSLHASLTVRVHTECDTRDQKAPDTPSWLRAHSHLDA